MFVDVFFLVSLISSPQEETRKHEIEHEINRLLDEMLSLEKQRPESSSSEEAQAVTLWVVSDNVDHEKMIKNFGCDRTDESLIAQVESLTSRRVADCACKLKRSWVSSLLS
ncbi:unnamed protein product [Brassica oleracea]